MHNICVNVCVGDDVLLGQNHQCSGRNDAMVMVARKFPCEWSRKASSVRNLWLNRIAIQDASLAKEFEAGRERRSSLLEPAETFIAKSLELV